MPLSGGGEPAGADGALPPAVRKAAFAVSVRNKSVSSLRLAAVTSKAAYVENGCRESGAGVMMPDWYAP